MSINSKSLSSLGLICVLLSSVTTTVFGSHGFDIPEAPSGDVKKNLGLAPAISMKMAEIFKKIGQIDDVSQSLKNLDLFSNPEEKNATIAALIQSGSVYGARQLLTKHEVGLSLEQKNAAVHIIIASKADNPICELLESKSVMLSLEQKNAAIDALIQSGSVYGARQLLTKHEAGLSPEQKNTAIDAIIASKFGDGIRELLESKSALLSLEQKNAAIDAVIQSRSPYGIRQILRNSKIVLSSEQINLIRIVSPEEYDSYQRYRETSFFSNLDRKTSFFSNFVYPMLSSLIDWTVNIFVLNYNESFLQDRYRMLINASSHSEIARSLDPYLSKFIDYIKFGSRFTSLDVLRKATDTVFPPSEENDFKFLEMVFFNDHRNELNALKKEAILRLGGELNSLSETWRSNLLASATIGQMVWAGWQEGSCSYLFLEGALLPLKVYLQRGYKFEAMLQSSLFLVRNSPIIWQCGQEIVAGVVESTRDPSLHKTDL